MIGMCVGFLDPPFVIFGCCVLKLRFDLLAHVAVRLVESKNQYLEVDAVK